MFHLVKEKIDKEDLREATNGGVMQLYATK